MQVYDYLTGQISVCTVEHGTAKYFFLPHRVSSYPQNNKAPLTQNYQSPSQLQNFWLPLLSRSPPKTTDRRAKFFSDFLPTTPTSASTKPSSRQFIRISSLLRTTFRCLQSRCRCRVCLSSVFTSAPHCSSVHDTTKLLSRAVVVISSLCRNPAVQSNLSITTQPLSRPPGNFSGRLSKWLATRKPVAVAVHLTSARRPSSLRKDDHPRRELLRLRMWRKRSTT